jgi:hypothetical protein
LSRCGQALQRSSMKTVQRAKKLLREVTRAEKAQLLQPIVQDVGGFPWH